MATESACSKMYGVKFRVIAWIHSHVKGAPCGFSTIHVHTQYEHMLNYPNIVGIVVEIARSGVVKADAFSLTEIGFEAVAHCSRTSNLSSVQHGSCSSFDFFKSVPVKSSDI